MNPPIIFIGSSGGASGGGGSGFDGIVQVWSDLPVDSSAALDDVWLVRESEGVWFFGHKQRGLWQRVAETGVRETDWQYLGEWQEEFSDANFQVYNAANNTKVMELDLSMIASGTTRTLIVPNQNGTIALTSDIAALSSVYQPLDDDLTAIAALSSTGLSVRTATDTWTLRSLVAPAAGITIANPAGVSGDPTFALSDDLAALEGLGSTGFAVRTAANTWTQRIIASVTAGISVTNGSGVAGNVIIGAVDNLLLIAEIDPIPTFILFSWQADNAADYQNYIFSGAPLSAGNGGTSFSTYAQGDLIYASAANTLAKLAKNTSATRYLSNTGASNSPAWAQIVLSNGISGFGTGIATALAVNVGSAGAPVVNGGVLGTPSSGTVTNLTGTASININGTVGGTTPEAVTGTTIISTVMMRLKNYTVAGLPAGTQGDMAYCTDLLAPAYNAAAVGGGAVVKQVFYNGAAWVT